MDIVLDPIKSMICLRGSNASVNWNPTLPAPHLNPVKLKGM